MAERQISTTRFGDIAVDDSTIIDFPEGLLGFVAFDQAVLLPIDPDGLFLWIQSVTDPALAFLVLTPWPLFKDYELALLELDQDALGLEEASDALVFCLLTSHDEPRRFTVNLLGPLVINQALRLGRQVVLNADLPTRAELPEIPEDVG